jgi:anti-repressor protein
MDKLIPFNYNGHEVRTVILNGEPWFVAKDVCDILEIGNSRMALERLDSDEKGVSLIDTLGGKQEMSIISESGLYSLTLGSKKPQAKPFKRWVTHEVIPSIRKTGGYVNSDEVFIRTYLPFADEQTKAMFRATLETIRNLNAKIEVDKPKVLFANAVETSKSSILIGDLAKLIRQNGYNIGQNRLFEWLRNNGYLIKNGERRNMPTQRSMELGLFEIKERTINNPDGSIRITKTVKVTGKGQEYFINKFLGQGAA